MTKALAPPPVAHTTDEERAHRVPIYAAEAAHNLKVAKALAKAHLKEIAPFFHGTARVALRWRVLEYFQYFQEIHYFPKPATLQ